MEEDVESNIAIRFVHENDYKGISSEAVLATQKLKKDRPSWSSWFVSKQCCDVDSSDSESSSEEDEEVSASEEEAVTETDSELESASEIQESSCSDDSSAYERKRRISVGKPKPALSHLSTVTKPSKKAPKKSHTHTQDFS